MAFSHCYSFAVAMVLIFVRDGPATHTLNLASGAVVNVNEMSTMSIGKPTYQMLDGMKVGELSTMMSNLGFRAPPARARKDNIINAILNGWDDAIAAQVAIARTEQEKMVEQRERMKIAEENYKKSPMLVFNSDMTVSLEQGKSSKLNDEGWNSDKEDALKLLEEMNKGAINVDTDRMRQLRVEKAQYEKSIPKGVLNLDEDEPEVHSSSSDTSGDDYIYSADFDFKDYLADVAQSQEEEVPDKEPFVIYTGDKNTSRIKLQLPSTATIADVKAEVVSLTSIPEGGFHLLDFNTKQVLTDDVEIADCGSQCYIGLLLKGGGKTSVRKEAEKREKMKLSSLKFKEKNARIDVSNLNDLPFVKEVEDGLGKFLTETETNSVGAMKALIDKMDIDHIKEAMGAIEGTAGVETKLNKISALILGSSATKVSKMASNMASIVDAMNAGFTYGFNKCKADVSAFNLGSLHKLLDQAMNRKIGANSSKTDAKMDDAQL